MIATVSTDIFIICSVSERCYMFYMYRYAIVCWFVSGEHFAPYLTGLSSIMLI